jgi:RNA 2',3'-cyclic 3'-phosphodiesterase
LKISVATANTLAGAAETLARRARDAGIDVRWVAPIGYHVTLKFLGWTRDAALSAIVDALDEAGRGTPRFTIKCMRLGGFPSLEKASVVWAGIEDQSGALDALAKRVETATTRLGFAAEQRAFHPHVTIGRLRETRPVREVVLPVSEQMFGDTRVDSMTLFESETKSSGSVYKEVRRIDFKTASETPKTGLQRQTPEVHLDATKRSSAEPETDTDDGWPRGHIKDD